LLLSSSSLPSGAGDAGAGLDLDDHLVPPPPTTMGMPHKERSLREFCGAMTDDFAVTAKRFAEGHITYLFPS
jgi:hypothetical protein